MLKAPSEKQLEEVEGETALDWVKAQNALSQQRLESHPEFETTRSAAQAILESKDKIPYVRKVGDYYYNFWQDEQHVRGLWRRTTLAEYQKESPAWDVILDFDKLAQSEDKNWVFKGVTRLEPDQGLCLVKLSEGGTDACVMREFDIEKKSFVQDGFTIPEAKSRVSWLNKDTLLLATDFGDNSLTDSGYPKSVRLLKRGQSLNDAKLLFEGNQTDVSVGAFDMVRPEGNLTIVYQSMSFFESQYFVMQGAHDDHTLLPLALPKTASLEEWFAGQLLVTLKEDWQVDDIVYPQGSLIGIDTQSLTGEKLAIRQLFKPGQGQAIESVCATQNKLYLTLNDNVANSIYEVDFTKDDVALKKLDIPPHGQASIISAENFSDDLMINYQSFLSPSTLYTYQPGGTLKPIKAAPSHFDSSDLTVSQQWVTSHDGTQVPYFLIHKKDMVPDGKQPTLLYGYGGFEVSLSPSYSGVLGKTWLEKGGVYALANIRGGGEFGPAWHRAALKENRQRAYDDFECVARDLITKKITSPKHLGIKGGSNGGLLVGVAFTQHPELYNAVVCAVPLLDMLKYHTLSAGASWQGEYGCPDDPAMRAVIEQYSPYHNVVADKDYPEVFFLTSTKDDRVHPSHARKMVARMQELGHPVIYYETIEGGHGAAANLKQSAYNTALTTCYLKEKLFPAPKLALESTATSPVLQFSRPPASDEEQASAAPVETKKEKHKTVI